MIKYVKKGKEEEEKKEFLQQVKSTVETIIEDVENDGDSAIAKYSETFDKWNPKSFRLSKEEISACYEELDDSVIEDIKWAQTQVRNFAQILESLDQAINRKNPIEICFHLRTYLEHGANFSYALDEIFPLAHKLINNIKLELKPNKLNSIFNIL